MKTKRRTYRNNRPRFYPTSLDTLHAELTEPFQLPYTLYWGPERQFDPTEPGQLRSAYSIIINEASRQEQFEQYLSRKVLIEQWPKIPISELMRAEWESRFPELKI